MYAPRQEAGKVIRAKLLNDHADIINDLVEGIAAPRQVSAPKVENEQAPAEDQSSEDWVAISHTSETVRVSNSEDTNQFVDVERFITVTFRTDKGSTRTLSNLNIGGT